MERLNNLPNSKQLGVIVGCLSHLIRLLFSPRIYADLSHTHSFIYDVSLPRVRMFLLSPLPVENQHILQSPTEGSLLCELLFTVSELNIPSLVLPVIKLTYILSVNVLIPLWYSQVQSCSLIISVLYMPFPLGCKLPEEKD